MAYNFGEGHTLLVRFRIREEFGNIEGACAIASEDYDLTSTRQLLIVPVLG